MKYQQNLSKLERYSGKGLNKINLESEQFADVRGKEKLEKLPRFFLTAQVVKKARQN